MRLAVLDTNVLVSAGINPTGAPAKIVMDWILEGQVQIATCPRIKTEYRRVSVRTKFLRYKFTPFWLEYLIEESMLLPDPAPWTRRGPDPSDLPFLALAHAAGAWLVSGNLKHFPVAAREGVVVVSPADYLAHLEHGGKSPR
jgi:putative PIN family toxin of toxin-antitoxin system